MRGEQGSYQQVLQFAPSDPLAERGRALGVVIAYHLVTRRSPEPPPGPQPLANTPTVIGRPPGTPPEQTRPPARWSLEAFAALGLPLSGPGAGFGGGLGLRLQLHERWGARLGARLRGAEIGAAQASYSGWAVAAGMTGIIRHAAISTVPGLTARAEGLLLYESLTHFSSDDPAPVRRGRLLPALGAVIEMSWKLTETTAVYLNGGGEVASGAIEIVVRRAKVTELSPWRAVAEAGFRTNL
jgi:hypothetical protein